MADCAELSKLIHENILLISQSEDVKNLDDAILRMQEMHPELHRDAIVQSITEATTRQSKEADALSKKLREISSQARIETRLKEKVQKIENYLETGMVSGTQKRTKPTTFAIEELRKTNANLSKWLRTSDPAMKKILQDRLKSLQDAVENGEIEVESEGKFHEVLQPIVDAIADARTKIQDAKDLQGLHDKIDALRKHLEEGTLPLKQQRQDREHGEAFNLLRETRDDLKKELAQSEPAQMERIQKQIDALEEMIASGEITPKQKTPAPVPGKELDKALYKRDLLREELRSKIYSAKPVTIWGRIGDVFDLKRLLQTTGELSFALRQLGMFAGMHPVQMTEKTLQSLRSLVDPVYRYKVNRAIFNDEDMPLAHRAGLRMTPIGSVSSLTQQEEYLMGRWSERIPVVREFTQAGITLLNLVRLAHFKTLYRTLGTTEQGMPMANAKFLGNAVNVFSGRPGLGKAETIAVGFNRFFYAPKWVISRFAVLYGQPVWHDIRKPGTLRLNPEIALKARAIVIGEYARFFASLAAYYSLSMLAGGELDDDRHSNTFGQVRWGKDKYIDPTMGIGRIIALHFQLAEGLKKSDATSQEKKLSGYTKFVEIARYGRGKLGPLPGDIVDFLVGETIVGEKVTVTQWLKEFPPIAWGDIYDAMTADQEVDENAALSVLTFFGQSLSVHNDGKQQTTRRRSSARRE